MTPEERAELRRLADAAAQTCLCHDSGPCPHDEALALLIDKTRGAPGTLPPEWDVRDETGCAYATSCPTREDAECVAAMLRAVAERLKGFV